MEENRKIKLSFAKIGDREERNGELELNLFLNC